MSGFDAALVGAVIAFIGFFISELDHPKRLRLIAAIFVICVTGLLALAWYANWETVVPLPRRHTVDTVTNNSASETEQNATPNGTQVSTTEEDITIDQALHRLRQGIDNLIAQVLIYGILIGVVVQMIKDLRNNNSRILACIRRPGLRCRRLQSTKDCGAPSPRPERRILRHNCGPYYCASPKSLFR